MTATPRFLCSARNSGLAASMSLKSISGMTLDFCSRIRGISLRREASRRFQDACRASSWPATRFCLSSAKRGSSFLNCMPDSEANASEMSPSRFDCVDVAALRMVFLDGVALLTRRQPARQNASILSMNMILVRYVLTDNGGVIATRHWSRILQVLDG
jgi:hypothetical protein